MPRSSLAILSLLLLGACGLYDDTATKRLFFQDATTPPPVGGPPVDHAKAAAADNLERALLEPDPAIAAALIRQAIGYLR